MILNISVFNKYSMETREIVRLVLDLLDTVEQDKNTVEPEQGEAEASRFKQIFAMLNNPPDSPIANAPNEVVADVDAVTTLAGGGVNGPKDPADIRIKDPRGFE
jgi:hypothetical protein